jgi:hypothetical protein
MRNGISHVVALVMLASGFLILPDTVLCLEPHNQCHLEIVARTSCNNDLPGPWLDILLDLGLEYTK